MNGVWQREDPRAPGGGDFAHRMSGDGVGAQPFGGQRLDQRNLQGEKDRLCDAAFRQRRPQIIADQLFAEIDVRAFGEQFAHLIEGLTENVVFFVQRQAHAGPLRAIAAKYKRRLFAAPDLLARDHSRRSRVA